MPSATAAPNTAPDGPPEVLIRARTGRPDLGAELRELWHFRHLLRPLVERDLRIRYKNSALGVAWTLVNPLIQVFVLTVFLSYILGTGPRNLSAFVFCATVPWTFFQTSVLDSASAVLEKMPLLKKVYFPREIPILATVCQNFAQFLITLGVFMAYRWVVTPLLHGGAVAPPLEILWLPWLIGLLFLLTLGVSFFVATATVFYEDAKFITSLTLNFLFYLSPIMYFAENIFYSARLHGAHVRWWAYHLYLANPLAWLITAFKQAFFAVQIISNAGAAHPIPSAPFDGRFLALTTATSLLVCLSGYQFFNRAKWKFTERP